MMRFTKEQTQEITSVFRVNNDNTNLIVNRLHYIKKSLEKNRPEITISVAPLDLDTIFLKTIDRDYSEGMDGRFVRVKHSLVDFITKPAPIYLQDIHGSHSDNPETEVDVPLLLFSQIPVTNPLVETQRSLMDKLWSDIRTYVPIFNKKQTEPALPMDAIRLQSMLEKETLSENDKQFIVDLDKTKLTPIAAEYYKTLVRIYIFEELI